MNCPKGEEEKRGSYLWVPIISAGTRGVGRSFDEWSPMGLDICLVVKGSG